MLGRRNPSRNRRGAAAVELAILLPVLMFIWVVSVDWARIFYYSITLEYSCRDGAYFGSNYTNVPYAYDTNGNGTADSSEIQAAALGETSNLSPAPTVTVGYDTAYNGTYASTTPTGNNYIKVTVTYTFTTVTNFPGVPSSTVLTRSARMAMAPTRAS